MVAWSVALSGEAVNLVRHLRNLWVVLLFQGRLDRHSGDVSCDGVSSDTGGSGSCH